MRRRQIPANDTCVFCGREENIEHSLLFCQFAQEVWRSIKAAFNIKLNRHGFVSTKEWLFDFLSKATELEATILAVVLWHLWETRNDVRNNQSQPDPRRTTARCLAYIDMIVQHCYKPASDHRRETSVPRKWSPPPPGVVLVNVDAALFDNLHRMAVGVVMRDHTGQCLLAASEPLVGYSSPELAETLALRRAVSLAREGGFQDVIFSSDCLSLIQRLNSKTPDRSPIGVVVADIRAQAAAFSSAKFRHVHRSINSAAHILARTCDVSSSGFVSFSAPECIRETLCIDDK
jgi:hypothetical protein